MAKPQISHLHFKLFVTTFLTFLCLINYAQPILMFVSHEQTYYSEYVVMKSGLEAAGYTVEVRSTTSLDFSIYMDPYLDIEAAALDGGGYGEFQTQFQNSFGSSWDEGLNAIPEYASVAGSIAEIENMDGYAGLIVVGGLGALDYRVDGQYEAQGEGLREISAALVQQAAEKLNELAIDALSQGKPVMAQCHGSSIPVFWRVPGTSGPGVESLGYSLLKGGKATGFPDAETPPLLSDFGIQHKEYDRVTISDPYSGLLEGAAGNGLVITTRDWYPQTVAYAGRTFLNILQSYPSVEDRAKTITTLVLHGGELDEGNCGPGNRANDVPCNYPVELPADYVDLISLLESASDDGLLFNVDHLDVTSDNLPYENQITQFIYNYLIQFDVVIFYKHWSTGFTDQLLQALADYVDDGGGLVALHHGLYNDIDPGGQSKDILVDLFGGQSTEDGWEADLGSYRLYNTNYGHFITSFMTDYDSAVQEPEDWFTNPLPVSTNSNGSFIPAKTVYDELYLNMAFEGATVFGRGDNQTVGLLSNAETPNQIHHTSAFCKVVNLDENHVRGKLFYLQVGENPENYQSSSFIGQVIRNGVRWSARIRQIQHISGNPYNPWYLGYESYSLGFGSSSGLPVQIESSDPTIAEIVGKEAILHKKGNIILTVSQSGNSDFYPVSREFEIDVVGLDQKLDLWNLVRVYGDPKFNFRSVVSGLPIEYQITTDSVIRIVGDSLEIVGAGEVRIVGYLPGSDIYEEAADTSTIQINPKVLKVFFRDHAVYGHTPDFSLSYDGFVYGEDENALLRKPEVIFTNERPEVGEYELTISGGQSTNYDIRYEYSTLQVQKAILSVGIKDTVVEVGEFIEEFELEIDGFQYDDDIQSISGLPMVDREFIDFDTPGRYPVYILPGFDANYDFVSRGDTLTVVPLSILSLSESSDINVYPNPFNAHFTITSGHESGSYSIALTDLGGKSLFHRTGLRGSERIEVKSLPPGVYILKLWTAESFKHELIIKEE